MPGFPVLHHLLEFAQMHAHQVGDVIQPSHPLSSPSPPALIRLFSNESALRIRWPKDWRFSSSISPSNEYSGLIAFRIDGFDLLAVQGTLKNLWCWRKLKASILRHSAFFTVQLSHLYVTTEKKIALTIQTFVAYLRLLIFLEACKTIYNVLLGNKTIHLRVIFP